MTSIECCMAAGPYDAATPYAEAKGTISNLTVDNNAEMRIYVSGTIANAEKVLLMVYDIFGLDNPRARQVADQLAQGMGGCVVMPDVLLGQPWDPKKLTPEHRPALMEWITSAGKFEGVIGPRMLATLEQFVLLQAPHAKVGTLGFCWGALMATLFATSHSQMVSAVSGCHPSRVTVDLVGSLHCPMLYAHAHDDPDVEPYEAIVKEKLPADVAAKCVFKKYASPAVHHGYVLRGPYEQGSEKTKAAEETVRMVAEFFSSNLA